MPKEMIHSRYADSDSGEPVAILGWGRDSEHVQLGVGMLTENKSQLEAYYAQRIRNAMTPSGVAIADADVVALGRAMASEPIELDGFWVQLGRVGINALIRNLRKARDQAYGADE